MSGEVAVGNERSGESGKAGSQPLPFPQEAEGQFCQPPVLPAGFRQMRQQAGTEGSDGFRGFGRVCGAAPRGSGTGCLTGINTGITIINIIEQKELRQQGKVIRRK